jgi:hypothetical protein
MEQVEHFGITMAIKGYTRRDEFGKKHSFCSWSREDVGYDHEGKTVTKGSDKSGKIYNGRFYTLPNGDKRPLTAVISTILGFYQAFLSLPAGLNKRETHLVVLLNDSAGKDTFEAIMGANEYPTNWGEEVVELRNMLSEFNWVEFMVLTKMELNLVLNDEEYRKEEGK